MVSRTLGLVIGLALSSVVATGCPRPLDDEPTDGGDDSGQQLQVCADASECPGFDPNAATPTVRCEGVCLFICNGVDEACPSPNMFCDVNGTCAFGCRDSASCDQGAGEVCRAGVCQVGSAECTSKCDCDPGEVCRDEQCVPAANACETGADCPRGPRTPTDQCEAFQCNGFTDQCFDPNPEARLCTQDGDCVGRPGCLGGQTCNCTASGACVPDTPCTVQTEQQACGFGNYCDGASCAPLPSCTAPADCTGGLVCNAGTGQCERSLPCASSAECTIAPNTHCANQFCTVPTCNNGGTQCTAPQVCNAQGRCAAPGTGVACTTDNVCQANQYCDLAGQECRVGCRNNSSCPAGQTCDGNRQCVTPGGGSGGQYGDPCVDPVTQQPDDSLCQAPMLCGGLSGTCAERCSTPSDCIACNARNQPNGCSCETFLFFGDFCQP